MKSRWIRGAWCVVAATAVSQGCASPGWMTTKSTESTQSGLHLSAASTGAESATEFPRDPYGELPQQAAATNASTGGVVLASLKQAGNSLTNALKIQPKVTNAADPVKLDNQPANQQQVAADLHYHAGYFFETQTKYVEAAAHYRDALKNAPDDPRVLAGYGRVQDQLGNPLEAEAYLAKACERAPQEPAYCGDLATCLARRQKWDGAIQQARRAVQLRPTETKYRYGLAEILVDSGQTDEAFRELAGAFGEANAQQQVSTILAARRTLSQKTLSQPTANLPRRIPAT